MVDEIHEEVIHEGVEKQLDLAPEPPKPMTPPIAPTPIPPKPMKAAVEPDPLPHTQDPTAPARMTMELSQLKESHEKLQTQFDSLKNDRERLQEALADKTRELMELQQAQGIVVKPPYEYKEDECHPVPPVMGAKCPRCGWTMGGKSDKDLEPHPVGYGG